MLLFNLARTYQRDKEQREYMDEIRNDAKSLFNQAVERRNKFQDRLTELQAKQLEEAKAFDQRKTSMGGATRRGLMYQGEVTNV